MKKMNLKGKFDLGKKTISILNEDQSSQINGGFLFDSAMTVRDTLTCHCDDPTDSAMTVRDTLTCHCPGKDSLIKSC